MDCQWKNNFAQGDKEIGCEGPHSFRPESADDASFPYLKSSKARLLEKLEKSDRQSVFHILDWGG
jgi:hypothetical protein